MPFTFSFRFHFSSSIQSRIWELLTSQTNNRKKKKKKRGKREKRKRKFEFNQERKMTTISRIYEANFEEINSFLGRERKAPPWLGAAPPQWNPLPPLSWSSGRNHQTFGTAVANSRRSCRCAQGILSLPPKYPKSPSTIYIQPNRKKRREQWS